MNTSYMLISVSVSFRHDAILPGNGYNTVSFINLIKSVKLCFKVNLRYEVGRGLFDISKYLSSFLFQMNCSSSMYMSTKVAED